MCGTYAEVREQLIDAAIAADMRERGFLLEGGEFVREYTEGGSPTTLRDRVPARGGGAPSDQLVDPHDDRARFSPAALYAAWEQRFGDLFEPFLSVPDPADFTVLAEQVWAAMADVSPGVPQERAVYVAPTRAMSRFLDQGRAWLHEMNGDTVEAFMAGYGGRVDDVAWAQFAALNEVHRAARVEAGVWEQTRSDFSQMILDALAAMRSVQPGGGGLDWQLVSAVTQKVTSVTSLFPPASFFSSVAVTFVDIVTNLSPQEATSLSASSAESVYRDLRLASEALDRQIRQGEEAIASHLGVIRDAVSANPGMTYQLPRPQGLIGERSVDDIFDPSFDRRSGGGFRIDPERCRVVGRDMMPDLASQLDGAASTVEAATVQEIWRRHPDLGRGSTGPYPELVSLAACLAASLRHTAGAIADAGEHLGIAADLVEDTDREVEQRLRQHTQRVSAAQYLIAQPPPTEAAPRHFSPALPLVG